MTHAHTTTASDTAAFVAADTDSIFNARILIADDEPLCSRLLASILRKQNFTNLYFADGGLSAMEQLRSVRPHLLLLDMQMPDLGGLEVCKELRTYPEFVDVPILIQTATVDRRMMGEVFAAGASDFLSKPINPAELIARVMVHLERRKLLGDMRGYHERISRELDAARRMQAELLPSPVVQHEFAAAAGVRIGSLNQSSSELGGDLWGLLPISDNSFGIFLADFTGHGVTAALNTFRLHALIHEHKNLHGDPVALVSTLNERLARLLPPGQFATFLYLVIDVAAAQLMFVSAGAPPPIVQAGLHGSPELVEASGLPLGILRGAQYELRRKPFGSNSRLLLFSDGLSEFADRRGERIGELGLVGAIDRCHPGLTPHEVIDQLCRVADISIHNVLPDDTTIICLDRRVGSSAKSCRDCMFVEDLVPLQPECRADCQALRQEV